MHKKMMEILAKLHREAEAHKKRESKHKSLKAPDSPLNAKSMLREAEKETGFESTFTIGLNVPDLEQPYSFNRLAVFDTGSTLPAIGRELLERLNLGAAQVRKLPTGVNVFDLNMETMPTNQIVTLDVMIEDSFGCFKELLRQDFLVVEGDLLIVGQTILRSLDVQWQLGKLTVRHRRRYR
jgi:hypothetical protein